MDFKFYTKITVASIYLYPKCVAIETMIMGVVSRLQSTNANFAKRGAQDHFSKHQSLFTSLVNAKVLENAYADKIDTSLPQFNDGFVLYYTTNYD